MAGKDRHVYSLTDPRDGLVKYLGCSSQVATMRVAGHVYGAK